MTARYAMRPEDESLHAYHDGELGWLARWRFERRLARSPELRRELAALGALGDLARRADAGGPSPDLWDDISRRLPGIDAEREEVAAPRAWSLGRPLAAAAAAAVAAIALAVGLGPSDTGVPAPGVVRWIDTGPRSVLVLDDRAEATIIWVLDGAADGASRGAGREVV